MNKVRMLVIGTGRWGINHCKSIKEISQAELVGIVGRSLDKTLKVGGEMGVEAFISISDAVKKTRPDAATIVLPHALHRPAALKVIEEGLHAYVEKSFGASLEDALAMAEKAKQAGVKIMAGFSQRYIPTYYELANLAKSGSLGRIRYVFAKRQTSSGFEEGHWTADPRLAGGGALAVWGTHDVDLAMHLTNSEPKLVYAQMEFDEKGRETQSHILVKHESGTISEIGIEYLAFGEDCFAWVLGDKGRADAEREGKLTLKYDSGKEIKEVQKRPHNFLKEALKAFVNSILNDSEPPIPAEDGIRVWKVVDAAYKSARTGRSIKL